MISSVENRPTSPSSNAASGNQYDVVSGRAAGVLERLHVVELLGDRVAEDRQERLRRRAGRALDRRGDEGDAELLLGDEEVEDVPQALLIAELCAPGPSRR